MRALDAGEAGHAWTSAILASGEQGLRTVTGRGRAFAALDLPPLGDIALVLLVGRGEDVAARAVGDEVEVVALRSGSSTASRAALPGLAIGVGGRPVDQIGVVGRLGAAVPTARMPRPNGRPRVTP